MIRRGLATLNVAATLMLLGVLLILVNFLASRRYVRTDLTKTKITELSDKTTQILKQLQEPVTIIVFYQPTHRLYELIRDLLREYAAVNQRLQIEYVDPEQDIARARQLATQFDIDRTNLVVFQSGLPAPPVGGAQAGTRHKYLSDAELAEYDYANIALMGQPSLKAFTGEEAFTSALISVTQAVQPLMWMTTGHGEKSVDDLEPLGLADLNKYLERENMRVESVTLLEKPAIPQTVNVLIVPGPTRRFVEQEIALVDTYLQQGGRLLALLDPSQDTGLEELLLRWGVQLGHNIVIDPARQLPFVSAANLFVTTYTQHPIVEKMQTLMTLFPLTRSVQPMTDLQGLQATALALTSPQGWGETNTDSTTFEFNEETDLKGPVPIATAVSREDESPTRLVVIGDSDFAANGQLGNVGNLDLVLGTLNWLAAQEQRIGIGPKPLESIKLSLTASQMTGVFWFSLTALPGLSILLGLGMWWIRRN